MRAWTQQEGIELCRKVEEVCPAFGVHVALTGGLLYKDGPRTDCDLILYRIRQTPDVNWTDLWAALTAIGFDKFVHFGFVSKCEHQGRFVDFLMPEAPKGEYPA